MTPTVMSSARHCKGAYRSPAHILSTTYTVVRKASKIQNEELHMTYNPKILHLDKFAFSNDAENNSLVSDGHTETR